MSKHLIESIHAEIGNFNGFLYFKVDNRLLTLSVSTPNFNDYSEWRISDFSYASEEYNPDGNTVELKPIDNFEPIQLSNKELEFLNLFSEKDHSTFDKNINDFISNHEDAINPYLYLDSTLLSSYIDLDSKLAHQIYKSNTSKELPSIPEYTTIQEAIPDYTTKHENWTNKKDITVEQGFYNILIPIMESYVNHYRQENENK